MSLFAAAALYYGMMPSHPGSLSDPAAANTASAVVHPSEAVAAANAVPTDPNSAGAEDHPSSDGNMQLALLSPTPSPIEASSDLKTYVPTQPTNPTTIIPLHYSQPDVNGLWFNGLDHLPGFPIVTASPAPVGPVLVTPSASVNP